MEGKRPRDWVCYPFLSKSDFVFVRGIQSTQQITELGLQTDKYVKKQYVTSFTPSALISQFQFQKTLFCLFYALIRVFFHAKTNKTKCRGTKHVGKQQRFVWKWASLHFFMLEPKGFLFLFIYLFIYWFIVINQSKTVHVSLTEKKQYSNVILWIQIWKVWHAFAFIPQVRNVVEAYLTSLTEVMSFLCKLCASGDWLFCLFFFSRKQNLTKALDLWSWLVQYMNKIWIKTFNCDSGSMFRVAVLSYIVLSVCQHFFNW